MHNILTETQKQNFSFMGLPNVDPKLISAEWIKNHYQMILWKLMALDMRYRQYLADDWLSPHHIMLQLKYRYDKEIDLAKRPCLRKICEQDDTANKRLVLVVAFIEKIENDSFKVFVSDGWYCVPAIFDKFLKDQIINKKIKPGTKLISCNAVWTGCDEPLVLPVDHFPPGCGLKLHGNSTRRARAFAKLGYQSNLKPFPVTLGSLNPNGGTASLINVVINRIYPLQYMETIYHPNQDIPQRVFRNERAEEFSRKQFDLLKENIINTTLEKMMSSVSTNKKRYHLGQKKDKVTDLCNGEDIMNWLNNSMDQESALTELSFNQQNMLRIYRENLVSDALLEKCPNRNYILNFNIRKFNGRNIFEAEQLLKDIDDWLGIRDLSLIGIFDLLLSEEAKIPWKDFKTIGLTDEDARSWFVDTFTSQKSIADKIYDLAHVKQKNEGFATFELRVKMSDDVFDCWIYHIKSC
uniref:Putative BRCA2 n=1 Tax=Schmidtea mediterranea TaxID=79327 RepID=A0A0X9SRF7_SCHMD|nr:putative BRCA2 [Schmidtea mediterranea]